MWKGITQQISNGAQNLVMGMFENYSKKAAYWWL